MTTVLNIVLLSLAGILFLAAAYFVLKGVGARSSIHRQAYAVGQVEARRASQINWIRAAFLFLAGLIFLGIFAIRPLIADRVAPPPPTPLPEPTTAPTVVATLTPTVTVPASLPTTPAASPTPRPTTAPTATSAPQTATVSSGVGVWLRGAPSTTGEQLEWLLDGTIVTLLPGQQTADDLLWQQVRTETGEEGWVARDFLAVNETVP